MSIVEANTSAARRFESRPSEWSEPRLDNRFFALVLAAMFAVLVTMLTGLVDEISAHPAPQVAAGARPSPPTALVSIDSSVGHH
jgi:hypothetical protein